MARTLLQLEEQFQRRQRRARAGSREYTGAALAVLDFTADYTAGGLSDTGGVDCALQGYVKNTHATSDLKYKIDPDISNDVRGEVSDWADATERTLEAGETFNWGVHGPEPVLRIQVNSDSATTSYRCVAGR
jgi:hypothetical protein